MIRFDQLLEVEDQNKAELIIYKENLKKKTPWIDKYRPTKLNEIIYQDEIVKMLKKTMETGNLPHMLFHGSPGSGKTSTILAVSMELFGPKKFKERVIELNASDERGINVVRNKIVTFAKTAIGNKDPNYLCPPYKIIILDEADAMTTEAQSALRKTMEDYSSITRFCFICNYIKQIIEPITSRCVKFRFKPLTDKYMYSKLKLISENESLNLNEEQLHEVTKLSEGDMRRAIMLLQNLKYVAIYKNKLDINDIREIAGGMPSDITTKILEICFHEKSDNVQEIINYTKKIRRSGYSIFSILSQINSALVHEKSLTDKMKSQICLHFSKTEKRLIEGADEYLQLLSTLLCMKSVILGIESVHLKEQ